MSTPWISTRGSAEVTFSQAVKQGLAPDGGLFVPKELPQFQPSDFAGCTTPVQVGEVFLAPLVDIEVRSALSRAFSFEVPLRKLDAFNILELHHGPTSAFKDVGARFLAQCFEQQGGERVILVATSGDTGGAVASAFEGQEGTKVGILFPKGRVSPLQEAQLTCWGKNIVSLRVNGTFDDCQRLVKEAFAQWKPLPKAELTSANSINAGRLLPQAVYYAQSSLEHLREFEEPANYIIPTGNLGNALACYWARACGLPIGDILLSTNANLSLSKFFLEGTEEDKPSIRTLANAMDVSRPSNLERLKHLSPNREELLDFSQCFPVSDMQIVSAIRRAYQSFQLMLCPHTATAFHVWDQETSFTQKRWTLVSTAHAAKFREIVEPELHITGQGEEPEIPTPKALENLFTRPTQVVDVDANLGEIRTCLGI